MSIENFTGFPSSVKDPKRIRAAGFFILEVFNIMKVCVFFDLHLGILNYTRAVTGILGNRMYSY